VKTEKSDIERHVRATKIRMGSGHNLEGKLQRRYKETEQLSKIIEEISSDNVRIRSQIEVEKESC
jgi:hypothetical protein